MDGRHVGYTDGSPDGWVDGWDDGWDDGAGQACSTPNRYELCAAQVDEKQAASAASHKLHKVHADAPGTEYDPLAQGVQTVLPAAANEPRT
jgi:hypothetical protein